MQEFCYHGGHFIVMMVVNPQGGQPVSKSQQNEEDMSENGDGWPVNMKTAVTVMTNRTSLA